MGKHRGYWNYERCYIAAKDCSCKSEFDAKYRQAYKVSLKNGWLSDFTWFIKPKNKNFIYTEEVCRNEALKYKTVKEFRESSPNYYNASNKFGYLDSFGWLERERAQKGFWNYDSCYNEAQKYKSRSELDKQNTYCYHVALRNGWLDDYYWFIDRCKPNNFWTYETCYEEAKKYKSRGEFSKSKSAYTIAWRNGWLDDYVWFKDERIDFENGRIDSVYAYEFVALNAVYVGRTLIKLQRMRDYQHLFKMDAVSSFAKENDIPVPKMKVLETDLTVKDGVFKEGWWVEKYRLDGWTILNKAKTGSIGGLQGKKWTYEKCFELARNCSSKGEFKRKSSSAYTRARIHGWLDDYTWFGTKWEKKWNRETCFEEAKRYKSKSEFREYNSSAYYTALNKGWLDSYDWFVKHNVKWNRETCYEEAKNYKTRVEFQRSNGAAYKVAAKNGWLDDYIWFEIIIGKWNYETCFKEAQKYRTRTEFSQNNPGAYDSARRNRWLDDYTWLETKRNPKVYWDRETCFYEAKKYKSRIELKENNSSAYHAALKNGWLDDFTWFEIKRKPKDYWNKDTCHEEAKKYKSKKEFHDKCRLAYETSKTNGWFADYTWFDNNGQLDLFG